MQANYHTHTRRCLHASGTVRAYAKAALQNGLSTLGFSDHVPYPFPGGYRSGFRMEVAETGDYVRELTALREEMQGRLRILIGYEAEYYPDLVLAMLDNLLQYPCDYLILGQHFLKNEYDGLPSGGPFGLKSLRAYVDQCLSALETELFSCLAHPDIPQFTGKPEDYAREMERLCLGAKKLDVPLELNLLGLMYGRNYPEPAFWAVAADVGNQVILGCDAHKPSAVGDPEAVLAGERFLERFGIKPLQELPLRPPKKL